MSPAKRLPAPRLAGLTGLVLLAAVVAITLTVGEQPNALTRTTIRLALIEYAAALWLLMFAVPADRQARTPAGRWMRWLWTWACATFLVHVACAFHFTHGWSHAHAFEQTRLESGFGEGVYVNYLFMFVWMGDVAWWWVSSLSYARRTRWIDRALHGFMLFIAFNATIVFESGAVRWAGVMASVVLAVTFWRRRLSRIEPG